MTCSTCKKEPARRGQRTCKECHALYQQKYRRVTRARLIQKACYHGYAATVSAIMAMFQDADFESFNGATAAALVRRMPIPRFPKNFRLEDEADDNQS